jgi:UDP-N-acetylglucosamine diphosphorylase/glucosamine-1-phosphate N-acetyltransferase
MKIVVFEDERWENFVPLTYTRHVGELFWGTRRLVDDILGPANEGDVSLQGRPYLADVVKERLNVGYNTAAEDEVLLVNGRMRPGEAFPRALSAGKKTALMSGDELVLARVARKTLEKLTGEGVLTAKDVKRIAKDSEVAKSSKEQLFHNYWELVESNGFAIASQAMEKRELTSPPDLSMMKGPPSNILISESAEVEKLVALDASRGPIVIEGEAVVESFSRISGPCYIGPKAKVHSALIRSGTSICEGCKIGGEVENSIIMPHSNKAHEGYVGDSIVGEWVNLGAGSTFSNLKNTYGTVKVRQGREEVDTHLTKLGPLIGDMGKVSIGCMIFAGTRIGVSSHLVGLVSDDVPSFTYQNGGTNASVEVRLDAAITTQRRMMDRRGIELSKAQERLITYLHRATAHERKKRKVKKGPMR